MIEQKTCSNLSDHIIAKRWMRENLGFYLDVQEITPEKARAILDDKGANRKISKFRVSQYATIMKEGQWKMTHQGIVFDEKGQLSDGQHRLEAIIKCGIPQTFIVFYQVSRENPLDVGLSRRDYDDLAFRQALRDDLADRNIFAIFNSLIRVNLKDHSKYITPDDKALFVNKYADEFVLAQKIANAGKSHGIGNKAPIKAAILAALICNIDCNELENFARILNTGFYSDENQTSAMVLRNSLVGVKLRGWSIFENIEFMTEEALKDFLERKPRRKKYPAKERPFSSNFNIIEIINTEKEKAQDSFNDLSFTNMVKEVE